MDWTKLIPSLLAVGATVAAAVAPQVQALLVAHPIIAMVLGGIVTIVANFTTPPHKDG